MQKQTIAVLLTCHNRLQSTQRALTNLVQQTGLGDLNLRVFVVDDGSTDGTSEMIVREFPAVTLLHGDGSLFWNRGMHMAFSAAVRKNFDFYLWLNDDTLLFPDAISRLLAAYRDVASKGFPCSIVAGSTKDPETGEYTYGGVRRKAWWKPLGFRNVPPTEVLQECDAANGNIVLIPAEVVRRVGVIDGAFHHKWGDHDYCMRTKQAGGKVWIGPGYFGTCGRNYVGNTWEDVNLPLRHRYKLLRSVKGIHPADYRIYARRHGGVMWFIYWCWPYVKILYTQVRRRQNKKFAS